MVTVNARLLLLACLPFLTSAAPTTPADLHHVLQRRADCRDDLSAESYCQVRTNPMTLHQWYMSVDFIMS